MSFERSDGVVSWNKFVRAQSAQRAWCASSTVKALALAGSLFLSVGANVSGVIRPCAYGTSTSGQLSTSRDCASRMPSIVCHSSHHATPEDKVV